MLAKAVAHSVDVLTDGPLSLASQLLQGVAVLAVFEQVQGDVDDHVFLAADHPPFAQFDEDV